MALIFDITAASIVAELDPETRKGEAAFTVSNLSGRLIRGRAIAKALNPISQPWLSIEDDAERSFQPNGSQPYTAKIKVPVGAPGGDYRFQLDMIEVSNPDETYTNGPAVSFVVPPPPVEEKKPKQKFPWWIVAAAVVAAIVIIGGIIIATRPREPELNWAAIPVEEEGASVVRLVSPFNNAQMQSAISGFRDEFPSLTVDHIAVGLSNYEAVIATMFASGEEFDVVWISSDRLLLDLSHIPSLVILTPYLEMIEWSPGATRNGHSGDIEAVGNWSALGSTCCSGAAAALALYLAYEYDGVR